MDILTQTDWKEVVAELQLYRTALDIYNAEESKAKKKELKTMLPKKPSPNLRSDELLALDLVVATKSTPVKDGDKYSPSKTLATVEDERLKDYIKYTSLEISRSSLYYGNAKDNARWCSLVPIFMAAHKQYNGINYEDWDKDDKFMDFILGKSLAKAINKWRDVPLSEELQVIARMNALKTPMGKDVAVTQWPRHNIKIDSKTILKNDDLFRHIWLQTWMANVELRNEYMILDVNNWDLVPPALDAVFEPKELSRKEIVDQIVKYAEDLPW